MTIINGLSTRLKAVFRRRPIGFRTQIMLLLVSLCIICTGLMGIIGYTITNRLNKKLVLSNLKAQTDSTYNLIDSAVNTSIRNYLTAIAQVNKEIIVSYYDKYKAGKLSEKAAKAEVEKILLAEKIGDTGYFYVIDSNGHVMVHPYLKGANLSNYDFIKTQIARKRGYLEYSWKNPNEIKEKKKALYMTYFEPWDYIISVSSYKSEFINLVNINDFKDNVLATIIGKSGYMFIMDSSGKLIIHPKQEGANIYDSVDLQGNYFIREIIEKKSGMIIYPWKNPGEDFPRKKIVVYRYYEPMDWYICSGVYIDELAKPVQLMKRQFITISLAILILSVLISIAYSKALLQPIRMLIAATERVIAGNYDVQIRNERHDEIGQLINIFNQMILKNKDYMESIQLANRKLEQVNVDLEQKVRERTQQLELLSNLDSMTGIANRRKMDEYLNHEWESALREKHPLSLIILDIDFFKYYNDTYGHPAGDECLKKIVRIVVDSLKRSVDFVARYGGEEFVIILSNTSRDGAVDVAEKIRGAIEAAKIPHSSSPISSYVTVSLGISTLQNFSEQSLTAFFESADEALYAAKQDGRNRSVSVVMQ